MSRLLARIGSRLRRIGRRAELEASTDRALLERFATTGEEEPFTLLVQRHGSLVLGVCRRVLGNAQDAEDAFQATFLVLARKAAEVAWQDSVKNWLHGVAYRVALKARRRNLKRRVTEAKAGQQSKAAHPPVSQAWDEVRPVLDAELASLPDRYRAPLLLCYLEGKTRDEAAEELGWSVGSVKGRLERGREMLRHRLTRRGLNLSAVLCAALLPDAAPAWEPSRLLLEQTTQAALGFLGHAAGAVPAHIILLAKGVLNAMLISKLKFMGFGFLIVLTLGLGVQWAMQSAPASQTPPPSTIHLQTPDLEWIAQRDGERDGEREKTPKKDMVRGGFVSFDGEKGLLTLVVGGEAARAEKMFHFAAKDTPFTSSLGETFRPAALPRGTLVVLTLNELGDVAKAEAIHPTLSVVLSKVNPARGAFTVESERGETPFKVAPRAKILLNGKAAKLEDFRPGTRVTVTLDFARETVLAFQVGGRDGDGERGPRDGEGVRKGPRDGEGIRKGPKDGDGGRKGPRDGDGKKPGPRDGDRPAKERLPGGYDVRGMLTQVHLAEGTIEVLEGAEGDSRIKTYVVPKDLKAEVKMDGVNLSLTLAQLGKPVRTSLKLAADGKTVTALHVQLPVARVTIQGIDAATGALIAGPQNFSLDREVSVFVQGKASKLDRIVPGMTAVYYLNGDRTRVLMIQAFAKDRDR